MYAMYTYICVYTKHTNMPHITAHSVCKVSKHFSRERHIVNWSFYGIITCWSVWDFLVHWRQNVTQTSKVFMQVQKESWSNGQECPWLINSPEVVWTWTLMLLWFQKCFQRFQLKLGWNQLLDRCLSRNERNGAFHRKIKLRQTLCLA